MPYIIDEEEWYPVRMLNDLTDPRNKWMIGHGTECEVSPELVARYNRVMDEFDAVQNELAKILGR